MKLEQINDTFKDVELRFDVDNWEIDGVKLWPFIRVENYMLQSFRALGSNPSQTRTFYFMVRIIKSKIAHFYTLVSDIKNNFNSKGNADIVFLSDGMSFVNLEQRWYSKFFDPLASEFSLRGFTSIRFDLGHNFYNPTFTLSHFIQPQIDNIIIKLLILAKIFSPKFANEEWGDFEVFRTDIFVNKYFIKVPSKESLRKKIQKINNLKFYYITKLKRINPKLGFVVNFYGDEQMAFILACKELNITTIDIQHGVQGPLHLGYGNWNRVPKYGYPQLPNYFWVWSKFEKENIDKWSKKIGCNKAVVVGNLFSQIWKDGDSKLVVEFDKKFQNLKKYKAKYSVLITLSPHTESLMGELLNVLKKTQYDFNWFIRLHPGMVKDLNKIKAKLNGLDIHNYEISETSCLPLQTILRNVDAHITCQSSCVIEAADFGVLSIITSDYGKALYKDIIDSKKAFYINKEDDIIILLNKIINKKNFLLKDSEVFASKNKALEELISNYLI